MLPRPRALYVGVATVLLFALTACGSSTRDADSGSEEPDIQATPTSQVTAAPAADAKIIDVTLNGDTVDPNGAQVPIKRDQAVVLRITADKAGELHVHSSPEQHIAFPVGTSEVTLSFDKVGLIAVEDHALDKLIVQLEVS
jgi:hypothetical protein